MLVRQISSQPMTRETAATTRKKAMAIHSFIAQAAMIRDAAARLHLPVIHNPCPADGHTKRQEVKELIAGLERQYPKLKEYVFASMQRLPLGGWAPKEMKRRPRTE